MSSADPAARAEWLASAIQLLGTLLFNLSTGAALWAHRIPAQRRFVWFPDANGSVAFLVSGVLGVVAVTLGIGMFELRSRDWQAAWVNMVGSLAFGVSAAGAFVKRSGVTADALLANAGTFFGALCFLGRCVPAAARPVGCRRLSRPFSRSTPCADRIARCSFGMSRSSRTSTTGRPRWSTRCCDSPAR
ncbi:MAG: hypothetical protein ACM4D3_10840 [Candidatus Sericytochromatia bacterium]